MTELAENIIYTVNYITIGERGVIPTIFKNFNVYI